MRKASPPPLSLEDVQKQAKTRAIFDGVDTAEGQQRLPLYRLQHKTEPDLIAKAEKAQADTLKQMRAKWLAPPLRLAFETAYRRTLAKTPPGIPRPRSSRSPTSRTSPQTRSRPASIPFKWSIRLYRRRGRSHPVYRRNDVRMV